MNGEHVAGAPGSITLGGRTFLVAQATHGDLMTVRQRLKKFVPGPLQMYAQIIAQEGFDLLPQAVRDRLASEAAELAMKGEKALSAELVADLLCEASHCRFLAWILLRKHEPALKLEDLAPLIDDEVAPAVFAELARESGLSGLTEADPGNSRSRS